MGGIVADIFGRHNLPQLILRCLVWARVFYLIKFLWPCEPSPCSLVAAGGASCDPAQSELSHSCLPMTLLYSCWLAATSVGPNHVGCVCAWSLEWPDNRSYHTAWCSVELQYTLSPSIAYGGTLQSVGVLISRASLGYQFWSSLIKVLYLVRVKLAFYPCLLAYKGVPPSERFMFLDLNETQLWLLYKKCTLSCQLVAV